MPDAAVETAHEQQREETLPMLREKHSALFLMRPKNITEAMKYAEMLAASDLVPKDYKGKAGNVLIAMQMGAEVGLSPMAAIQNISVINGRPSLWGDSALAVVQAHPAYESHDEKTEGEGQNMVAIFKVKRRGHQWYETRFSVQDALKANLWTKDGPWKQYPKRMLQMRARSFGLRDKFADALRGLSIAEEAMDIPERDDSPVIEGAAVTACAGSIAPEVIAQIKCVTCNKEIKPLKVGDQVISAERILLSGKEKFGGANVCGQCQIDIKNGTRKAPGEEEQATAFATTIEHIPDSGGLVEVTGVVKSYSSLDVGNRKKFVIAMADGYELQTWHIGSTTRGRLDIAISRGEPTLFMCQETEKSGVKYIDANEVVSVGGIDIQKLELNSTLIP